MVKKEGGKLQQIAKSIGNVFSESLKFLLEGGLERIKEVIHRTEKKIIQSMYAAVILLAGILFIAVGLAYLLDNLIKMGQGVGFLIVGLVLVIIALIIKSYIHQTYS